MVLLISDAWMAGGMAGPAGQLATARWQNYALGDRCGPIRSASCFELQQRPSESIPSSKYSTASAQHCSCSMAGLALRLVCAAMGAEHLQWGAHQRLAGFTVSFTNPSRMQDCQPPGKEGVGSL